MSRKSATLVESCRGWMATLLVLGHLSGEAASLRHDVLNMAEKRIEATTKTPAAQQQLAAIKAEEEILEQWVHAVDGADDAAGFILDPPDPLPPHGSGNPTAANDNNPPGTSPTPANDNNPNDPPTSSASQSSAETAQPPANAIGSAAELETQQAGSHSSAGGGASASAAAVVAQASAAGSFRSEASDDQASAPEAVKDAVQAANDNSSADSSDDADVG